MKETWYCLVWKPDGKRWNQVKINFITPIPESVEHCWSRPLLGHIGYRASGIRKTEKYKRWNVVGEYNVSFDSDFRFWSDGGFDIQRVN